MAEKTNGNPYSQFLGLAEQITQPDHYQLLGVERYLDDANAIKNAAIQQNNQLREWQNNDEFYTQVRTLEMEVATAMQVLVDPEKKQAYDQTLSQATPVVESLEDPQEAENFQERIPPPRRSSSQTRTPLRRSPAKQTSPAAESQPKNEGMAVLWWAWGLAGVASLVLIGWAMSRSRPDTASGRREELSAASNEQEAVSGQSNDQELIPEVPNEQEAVSGQLNDQELIPEEPNEQEAVSGQSNDQELIPEELSEQEAVSGQSNDQDLTPEEPKLLVAPFNEATAQENQKSLATFLGKKVVETNGSGMQMVLIPPGQFPMGDGDRAVAVTLTEPYFLGRTEVTQGQWESVIGTSPWKDHPVKDGSNYPATYVGCEDAMAFCKKLTEQEHQAGRLPEDWEYTLPTEAQWEYACRAGTTTAYSFGDEDTKLRDYGWFYDKALDVDERRAHEVGTKKPNPWGLLDMHGNVGEWCRDGYADKLPGGRDPEVTAEGLSRIIRGGSWYLPAAHCRSAFRFRGSSSVRSFSLGFRVARVLSRSAHQRPDAGSIANRTGEDQNEKERKTPLAAEPMPEASSDSVGPKAGEIRSDNDLDLTLVWCPPGNFSMGSPESKKNHRINENQVQVTLTNGFWLGQTEVTQGQWESVMDSTPWKGESNVKEGPNYPATEVSWGDAIEFCKKLTEKEQKAGRLPDHFEYTLPTEAQWEYACRAGETTAYCFGDDASKLGDYAWFKDNTGNDEKYAHEVGQKKASRWGLYDMHGNVYEWCKDKGSGKLLGGRDPETLSGYGRVYRGGSWHKDAEDCRSAYRNRRDSSNRNFYLGFRVARVLSNK